MARRLASGRAQRGAALIVFATVLILGVAWFTVGALGKMAPSAASREIRTGETLQAAKRALLDYVTQHAARSDTANPGQMPCPESLTLLEPGEASSSCSTTAIVVGRLPWKTLGIDQPRDGRGEPLWYMLRGFRAAPINFGTPAQLAQNGSPVVALIIAPGSPLDTSAVAGTPPADCSKLDQFSSTRNSSPLLPANFIECGVVTGSVASPGDAAWTNDRVIAITAVEWMDAVGPAVGDRLQRQVAPAMYNFYDVTSLASWGERFFPNASALLASIAGSQPPTNDLCGDNSMRSGMPPTATITSGLCGTTWTGTSSGLALTAIPPLLSFGGCAPTATELRCTYNVLLALAASPSITAIAPRVAYSFRSFDPGLIVVEVNGITQSPSGVINYSDSVSTADGSATIDFQIAIPVLALGTSVVVRIPHPTDALLADTRSAWFVNNGWDRYTYYGVAQAATHDPGLNICTPGGNVSGCLTVNGTPAPNNDKRLVLTLMGRQLPGKATPSYDVADYLEYQNASVDTVYETRVASVDFNDRVAACPYKYQNHTGADVVICN